MFGEKYTVRCKLNGVVVLSKEGLDRRTAMNEIAVAVHQASMSPGISFEFFCEDAPDIGEAPEEETPEDEET